ncbi:MAG: MerR family transcriptional regulator [Burkholderiales bacterium]
MERYPISWVEKATGVSKEALRKWEERYGFPNPVRDERGNRFFLQEDISRIAEIRHLTNQGVSASKAIKTVTGGTVIPVRRISHDADEFRQAVFSALSNSDAKEVKRMMRCELNLNGLSNFVLKHLPRLNEVVGEKWASGEISIYQEHLYTDVVQQVLRRAISEISIHASPRVIVLATPPGELHTLGLLMVQALLVLNGNTCISLGPQMPIAEMTKAAKHWNPFAIGISFSAAYPKRGIGRFLSELRAAIPEAVEIWLGGSGAQRVAKMPDNMRIFRSIQEFDIFLKEKQPDFAQP